MATNTIRLSQQGLRLLRLFMERPRDELAGVQIAATLKIGSGTLYPLLARFERSGWLISKWEEIDPKAEKRPRKRFYWITPLGQNSAREALEDLSLKGEYTWNTF